MRQTPKILKTEIVANSRLFRIESVDLEFNNGEKRVFERIKGTRGHGTIMMIPVEADNDTVLLVREYAVGLERYEIGLPKGIIEIDEDPKDAANRELKEELGLGARKFTFIKSMSNAPGFFGSNVFSVLVQDFYEERLEGDEPEPIEIVPWKLSRLEELLERDDFSEARSIAALFIVRELLKK